MSPDEDIHRIVGGIGADAGAVGVRGLGGIPDRDAQEIRPGMGRGIEGDDAGFVVAQGDGRPEGEDVVRLAAQGDDHVIDAAGDGAGKAVREG